MGCYDITQHFNQDLNWENIGTLTRNRELSISLDQQNGSIEIA